MAYQEEIDQKTNLNMIGQNSIKISTGVEKDELKQAVTDDPLEVFKKELYKIAPEIQEISEPK